MTLVAHLNAKLINRVWDFLFVSPFFMFMFLTRARDEISIYNSLSSPGMFGWVFFLPSSVAQMTKFLIWNFI